MTSATVDPEDELFAMIGRYVITFQWLEGKIDQCLLLLWGYDNWSHNQARLAAMSNQQKVDALLEAFHTAPSNARGRTRPDWVAAFETLIERLHDTRRQRNALLHSQYLFDFQALGQPVLRSHRRRQAGDVYFDQEGLSKEAQDKMLQHLADLCVEVNFAQTQLIHDQGA